MAQWYYVKDRFVPEEQAVISIQERGFRFGDGVFETIRVSQGTYYQWDFHLHRLQQALASIRLDYSTDHLAALCQELLIKNNVINGFIRISISRGIGSIGYLPTTHMNATLVIETLPLPTPNHTPVSLFVSSFRKPSTRVIPAKGKTMQGLNSILARMEAHEHGCFESLLLGERAHICEGSSSHIFWFAKKTLFTPSLHCGITPGSTRSAIIRLSPYPVEEGAFLLRSLEKAEQVFITNVAWQVVAVKELLPLDYHWENNSIAHEFQALLEKDIQQHTHEERRQLRAS